MYIALLCQFRDFAATRFSGYFFALKTLFALKTCQYIRHWTIFSVYVKIYANKIIVKYPGIKSPFSMNL